MLDDYVIDVAWSPDATALAVIGGEGRVLRVGCGAPQLAARRLAVQVVGEHMMGGLAVAWQPKGNAFATSGHDNAVVIWDGATGERRMRLTPAMTWSSHLAYSADGTRLAVATGRVVSLWSADGTLQHRFAALGGAISALAWDPAGRDLCAATNGGLFAERIETAGISARAYKWPASCLTVAYSPNGRVLASGTQDGTAHFWHLGSGKDSQMRGYPGKVNLTSWSANSRYLATNAGNQIVLWDFSGRGPEGSKPLQLSGHTDLVECLAFHPTAPYLISAGRDWRLTLWLPGKAEQALDAHLTDSEASTLRWSPDGRYVAVGERKGKLTVFELVQLA